MKQLSPSIRIATIAALAAAMLAMALPANAAAGSGNMGGLFGSSDSGGGPVVEADKVRSESLRNFREELEQHREQYTEQFGLGAASEDEIRAAVDQVFAEYARELDDKLAALQSDGVLGMSETSEIGKIQGQHIDRLKNLLHAAHDGAQPPPRYSDYEEPQQYAWDLAKYALTERNAPWEILLPVVLLLVGLAIAGLLVWALKLARLRANGYRIVDSLADALKVPLYLSGGVIGFAWGLHLIWVPVEVEEFVWPTIKILFVAAVFAFIWQMCAVIADFTGWIVRKTGGDGKPETLDMIAKLLRLTVLIVGVVIILRFVFQAHIIGVVTSLGIIGLAVSLAAQGTLRNIFSSFTIYADRPFNIDDLVIYEGDYGQIERIGFRSTRLRLWNGHMVIIPNHDIVTNPVTNVSARPWVRRRFRLNLDITTPPDKVRKAIDIIYEILDELGHKAEDIEPHVLLEDFGDYCLKLLVQYYYVPPDYWGSRHYDSEVNLAIIDRFAAEGIRIAVPTEKQVTYDADDQPPFPLQAWHGGDGRSGKGAGRRSERQGMAEAREHVDEQQDHSEQEREEGKRLQQKSGDRAGDEGGEGST